MGHPTHRSGSPQNEAENVMVRQHGLKGWVAAMLGLAHGAAVNLQCIQARPYAKTFLMEAPSFSCSHSPRVFVKAAHARTPSEGKFLASMQHVLMGHIPRLIAHEPTQRWTITEDGGSVPAFSGRGDEKL